jgi:leader peptidase (prepilin peptidase) / N-methyltransferase
MNLLQTDPFTYYLCGSIIMFMLGIAAGNYVTSIIYRLPKGLVIANDPPYCECEKRMYLSKRDLFPFFSWFLNKGQCRFCDIKIPITYTIVEFLCGFLFVVNWITYGMGEELVLILLTDAVFIGVAAIYFNEGKLYPSLLFVLGGAAGVHRTLVDGTTIEFISGGYLGLMIGVVLWGLEMLMQRSKKPFPDYAIMLAMGGICVGRSDLIVFFIVSFIVACLIFSLRCLSENFQKSAWMFGVTISVLMALSHG